MGKKESIFTISINKKLHFYKKIIFDIKSHYKNIIYYYDLLDEDGEIIKSVKHNYENRPAELLYFNYQLKNVEYWVHGNKHRKWGPAVISFSDRKVVNEEWYHNGHKLTENEIKSIEIIIERKKKMKRLLSLMKR